MRIEQVAGCGNGVSAGGDCRALGAFVGRLAVALGLVLAPACVAETPAAGAAAPRAPVENPSERGGAQPGTATGAVAVVEVDAGEWSMQTVGQALAQTGHLMTPAGACAEVAGRVMGLALVRGGRFLVVKTDRGPAVLDTAGFKLLKQYDVPEKAAAEADREARYRAEADRTPKLKAAPDWEKTLKAKAGIGWGVHGGSMHGITVGEDDATVYLTGRARHLFSGTVSETGELTFAPTVDLALDKGDTNPLGVGLVPGGKTAVVALALANRVAIVDLVAGKLAATIPVGVCPYGVAVSRDGGTAFVSNLGGSLPRRWDRVERTTGMDKDGTPMAVDKRSVALRGTVSVIDLAKRKVVREIETGIHPEALALSPDGSRLYVVDASGDGVSVIDVARRKVVERLDVKPQPDLPYGSLANGLAVSADGKTLFTANAGNNAVALLNLERPGEPPFAFIAAGGFPGAVCVRGDTLYCGNVTGYAADVQQVTVPRDPAALRALTAAASRGFHLAEIVRAQARAASRVPPRPVPARAGEPSPVKHVVYIIKENKKFDQVLGDIGRGNCEPKFCEFPRATTPNAHALADEFVLLDNYYCGGVLSCDGHQWATQGLTSPYREKDWGNQHAIYGFGADPLCFAGCGFIWDHVLRQGLSFRNFGELGNGVAPKGSKWLDNYRAWTNGTWSAVFSGSYRFDALRRYSDLRFPGWNMLIPDQVRADAFLTALREFEAAKQMPDLVIVYLPDDHTQGGSVANPTPRAYVADNDLALGRVVEALSKSRFWRDMAIFINEDDPQTGADHVDGHRSLCFVASPYARRGGAVVSRFYNQSSVLHTICRIFGLPPMNQVVALAPVMDECFQATPDFTPYVCRPVSVPLDELNPDPKKAASKTQARLGPKTEKLDFSAPDLLDDDAVLFSRWAWATVRGDEPFPVAYTGAHGKGLKALGLRLDPFVVEDDD